MACISSSWREPIYRCDVRLSHLWPAQEEINESLLDIKRC